MNSSGQKHEIGNTLKTKALNRNSVKKKFKKALIEIAKTGGNCKDKNP
jgi:hypothetical protein